MLMPLNWTSLLLEWESPTCCYSYEYVDYNYTLTLTASDGLVDSINIYGNFTELTSRPSVIISLDSLECEEVVIEISLPGNCEPAQVAVTLLLGMTYNM